MAASCLGNLAMVPKYSVSPDLHPIMKEFSTAVNNAHQSLVKQASKSTDMLSIINTTWTMVIQSRRALDCGSAHAISSPSDLLGNSGHEAILDAIRTCIGSDGLCLIKKLGYHVKASSLGHVCGALRKVEKGLGVTTATVKPVPVINLLLDDGTPHFLKKHRSAPPNEKGAEAGDRATQILDDIRSVVFVGPQPDYATPPETQTRTVKITAMVQNWIWRVTKDEKKWIRQAGQELMSNIRLSGDWDTNGDFTYMTWSRN